MDRIIRSYVLSCFLILTPLMFSTPDALADYFQGMKCHQNISETDGLILDMVRGIRWQGKEYRRKNDKIIIGNVEFTRISYFFYDDRFYGIAVDIINKDNFNEVIRIFNKKYGWVIASNKSRRMIWYSDNKIFIVDRYSTHLAQVQIFCRDMYNKIHGVDRSQNPEVHIQK